MKGYSKAASHKGKVAYRTPSRWLAGKPEAFKKQISNIKNKKNFRLNNSKHPPFINYGNI